MRRLRRVAAITLALLVLSAGVLFFVYPGPVYWVDIWWGRMIDYRVYDPTRNWYPYTVGLDWSADGKTLASASYHPDVLLWDPMTGALQDRLQGHDRWLEMVEYSPDGSLLVSGDWHNTLIVWDVASGTARHTVSVPRADEMIGFSFHPSQPRLAVAAFVSEKVAVIDLDSGAIARVFDSPGPMDVAYSPDAKVLVAAGEGQPSVMLYDAATDAKIGALSGHTEMTVALDFFADGSRLLSCGDDATVRLWDFNNRTLLKTWKSDEWWVNFCSLVPGDRRFLASDPAGVVSLYDIEADEPLKRWPLHDDWATCVRPSRDGRYFASSGKDGKIQVYDMNEDRLVTTIDVSQAIEAPPGDG